MGLGSSLIVSGTLCGLVYSPPTHGGHTFAVEGWDCSLIARQPFRVARKSYIVSICRKFNIDDDGMFGCYASQQIVKI